MELFDTIYVLKNMGMPLKEIRHFMETRSPEALLTLYEDMEHSIELEIARLQEKQTWIAQKKAELSHLLQKDLSKIYLEQRTKQYLIPVTVENNDEADFITSINERILHYMEHNHSHNFRVVYAQHYQNITQKIYDDYDNAALSVNTPPKGCDFQVLPSGTYLVGYHIGHWNTIGSCYQRMMNYIQKNQLCPKGDFLEYVLIDTLAVQQAEDYITEVTIRV